MIKINDKSLCSGCFACALKCPVKAIEMVQDKEGFYYPQVHIDKCINCGLCDKVCPYLNSDCNNAKNIETSTVQKTFGAYNTDEDLRALSSSGGIFSALANNVLEQNGVVFGSAFDSNYGAEHIYIENKADLHLIIGSKYTQSKIGNAYVYAEKFLKAGRLVLFSGMACQIEGLMAYLGRKYDNLIAVDLICMGVPSPMVWNKYLKSNFKIEDIKYINFKDKSIGWNRFCVRIDTKSNSFKEVGINNSFMRCMFEGLTLRPSCYSCPYKKEHRASDITLADCWGAEKLVKKDMLDNKGLSTVVVHSSKGLELINTISPCLKIEETDFNIAIENNNNMYKTAKKNKLRGFFMWSILNLPPNIALKIFGSNLYFRLRRKINRITERIGI